MIPMTCERGVAMLHSYWFNYAGKHLLRVNGSIRI